MKKLLLVGLLFLGCGAENGKDGEKGSSCSIKGEKIICTDGTSAPLPKDGIDGKTGSAGKDGLKIKSNKFIPHSEINFCTYYTGETCVFNGGQIISFEDNTVMITGIYTYDYANDGEFDKSITSITLVLSPEHTESFQRLDHAVTRDGVTSHLYLKYNRADNKLSIIFDSNENYKMDDNDSVLETLDLSAL